MKRSERHHLKQNELATSVARLQETLTTEPRTVVLAATAVIVAAVLVGGFFVWRARTQAQAQTMLAAGLATLDAPVAPPAPAAAPTPSPASPTPATPATPAPPPPGSYASERAKLEAAVQKLMAAADAYPTAEAGIAARYHAATALATLGRTSDAEQRYREVIDRDGSGLYGQMARLGLATAHVQAKRYDEAITAIKEISANPNTDLPVDALLMQLGRTYAAAGRRADALQTYKRIVDEFPQSLYAADARREVETLESASKTS